MDIVDLADRPQHLDRLARWHHAEWSQLRGGQRLHACRRGLERTIDADGFPLTVVAVDGPRLLGSACLIEDGMSTRPHLSPWLTGVYVASDARGRGIGSALVNRIIDEATQLGFDDIYLLTTDQSSFYGRLGWQRIDDENYNGFSVTVMRREL